MRHKYALNSKNEDGLDSKWQHAGNTLVDDGTGMGTKLRACVKGAKMRFNTQEKCITCNAARRTRGSDKCNSCAVAAMYAVASLPR
jgi:hypothetical protein